MATTLAAKFLANPLASVALGTAFPALNDPSGTPDAGMATLQKLLDALEPALDHDALLNFVANEHLDWTADLGATNIHVGNITAGAVTQHQAALSITESQISDFGTYLTDILSESLEDLGDVTITAIASGELLKWNGTAWINNTLAEAGIAAASHAHAAGDITSGTFADARVAASNVTQHQAALSITESQVSDLGVYLTAITGESIGDLSDVTLTALGDGEVLASASGTFINRTLAEAGIAAASHTHTESDITDLGAYIASLVEDTTPQLGGALDVNGQKIVSVSNGNIDIEPHGTGNVLVGNFTFDADQTVSAGQDNYVLTYDNGTGLISLEAGGGGSGATAADIVALSGFTPVLTDLVRGVDDPAGTPTFGKLTFADIRTLLQANFTTLTASTSLAIAGNATLTAPSANVLELANSTTAQTLRVFNTRTDASNGEWGAMSWNSNVLEIGTYENGTGTIRDLKLLGGGANTFQIGSVNTTLTFGSNDDMRITNATHTLQIRGNITFPDSDLGFTLNGLNSVTPVGLRGGDCTTDVATAAAWIGGGNAQAAASTNLVGGAVYITGGDGASASAGEADGGAVYIRGGVGYGTGEVGNIMMDTLPTADPTVAGALWNNSGVLTVSAG